MFGFFGIMFIISFIIFMIISFSNWVEYCEFREETIGPTICTIIFLLLGIACFHICDSCEKQSPPEFAIEDKVQIVKYCQDESYETIVKIIPKGMVAEIYKIDDDYLYIAQQYGIAHVETFIIDKTCVKKINIDSSAEFVDPNLQEQEILTSVLGG